MNLNAMPTRAVSSARFVPMLLALAACGAALAGPGIWTSSGPNGGRVNALEASPFNANEFYAVSRSGVFKSVDGGVTWSDASAGINRAVFHMAHSRTAANRLVVNGANKLFYSDDGAATWQDRTPPAALLAGATLGPIAASPVLPGTYYVAVSDGRVLVTGDSGLSWRASPAIVQANPFAI
ncbi:MAG: WD40/YVTN/BNR-like repeat-containing protein, partial [Wenzhouxiangellaceae bacterium]